jgi:CheY-like chemotaxis protein
VAEDHPTNRKVVELILATAGYALAYAENGAEAVAMAEAERFDLILMDMQMPVMDGLTAIRHIRAHERAQGLSRTPILTLTANAMTEHARESRQAGADGHVTKPISAQALMSAVIAAITEPPLASGAAVA